MHAPASSIVTTCACGTRLRVPATPGARARCPTCRGVVAAPSSAEGGAGAGSLCPVCQTVITAGESRTACDACGLNHHRECWDEVRGCGAYGCSNAPRAADHVDVKPAHSAWGDNKPCPVCGEQVKSIAVKCRYCSAEFGTVDPLTGGEFVERQAGKRQRESLKASVIAVFVVSIIGLLAPLLLIISLAVVLPKRDRLRAAGPLYLAMGYASIGISAVYSLLMAGFAVLGG